MFNSSRSFLVPEVTTIRNLQNTKLNLNKNYFITSKMNHSKIDLFPVSRTETVETINARVTMSFDSYTSNVAITDGTNTLNIRIDQDKMMRAFLYSLGNIRCKYDDAKREFMTKVLEESTKQLVNATTSGSPERERLESFLANSFSNKDQEVNN